MELPQTIEIKERRVLTTKQLAEAYETTQNSIKVNFARNRGRFIEGKHYILLAGTGLREFKDRVTNCNLVQKQANVLYLWTEKGALLHAKSLNTDKAWEVYDWLVDFYFRAKEQHEAKPQVQQPVLPETKNNHVVDIPQNVKAQKMFESLRRDLIGAEAVLESCNRYYSLDDFSKVQFTLQNICAEIFTKSCDIARLKPSLIKRKY